MNRMTVLLSGVLLAASASAVAPSLTSVTSTQNKSTRLVTVNYTLADAPAVITLSVQTNRGDDVWVDIGPENLTYATGDVQRRFEVGDHTIYWHPDKAWPGHVFGENMIRIGVKAWAVTAPPDYMVVDLTTPSNVLYYVSAESVPGGVKDIRYKATHILMRKIPAAGVIWQMGSPDSEANRVADVEPIRNVALTEDYYIGVYELTQGQFFRINGSYWGTNYQTASDRDVHPQENMGRDAFRGAGATYRWPQDGHAVDPAKRVAKLRNKTGIQFDLPTSAQWEFACRAGASGTWGTSTLGNGGWYVSNSGSHSHEVGQKEANAFGLYDMHGNVGEFTLDVYDTIAPTGVKTVVDPKGPNDTGLSHVARGGSYAEQSYECRCAVQRKMVSDNAYKPYVGFRLWAPAHQPY